MQFSFRTYKGIQQGPFTDLSYSRFFTHQNKILKFTPDFILAATSNIRCPKALVEVTWGASEVDLNRVISSNDINRIDRTGQLFNGITASGKKWAHLNNSIKADGTFYAMPALDTEQQMGWYGSLYESDVSGNYSTPPFLTVTHEARSYAKITVAGDSEYSEYPVDFTVTFTHPGGPTVINVTGNGSLVYENTFTAIPAVTSIKLEITKWSAPNKVVKITQFEGSLIDLYDSSDIVDLTILEESNSDTGVVPIGNVSANELDLSLLNTDRRFSFGNTDSPYNSTLRSGRKIRVWLGFVLPAGSVDQSGDVPDYIVRTENGDKVGYMPYGVYWSKDWISSYDSQETTTTAYDVAYRLDQEEFLKSDNYSGDVTTIINTVMTEAKKSIPDLVWEVSTDLASENWGTVYFEPKSYLETLKDIAEATYSYSYVNRRGVLVIGSRLNKNVDLENYQKLTLAEYFSFKSQPKFDELVNKIRVAYTTYSLNTSVFSNNEIYEIDEGKTTRTLNIKWDNAPVDESTVSLALSVESGSPSITSSTITADGAEIVVTGVAGDKFTLSATGKGSIFPSDEQFTIPTGASSLSLNIAWDDVPVLVSSVELSIIAVSGTPLIDSSNIYTNGADITVNGDPGDTFTIKALGQFYDLSENTETTDQNQDSIDLYGIREFSLSSNKLITTQSQAEAIASLLLSLYGNLRQDAEISWPESTLVSVGDTVEVTEFKSDTVETKDYFVINRKSIKFTGALDSEMGLRRD